jgi:hypothetical protein
LYTYFDPKIERVAVKRLAKQLPWSETLKLANVWGDWGKYAIAVQRVHLMFQNIKWGIFDWESNTFAQLEVNKEEEKLVHPDFIAEILGTETESDIEEAIGVKPAGQGRRPIIVQRVVTAQQCAGRDNEVSITPRGVDEDISDDTTVIDLTGPDDCDKGQQFLFGGVSEGIKQEMVNYLPYG